MLELTVAQVAGLTELAIREKIDMMEQALNALAEEGLPQVDLPLKHTFTDGVYVREIFIPADTVLVGKIHRHAHLNYITKGKVTVLTKDGLQDLEGPCTIYSSAGTKRALYTHTDTIWTTVHANPTNETDPIKLEDMTITPDYTPFPLLKGELQTLLGESL